jgi:hypothetical protein
MGSIIFAHFIGAIPLSLMGAGISFIFLFKKIKPLGSKGAGLVILGTWIICGLCSLIVSTSEWGLGVVLFPVVLASTLIFILSSKLKPKTGL